MMNVGWLCSMRSEIFLHMKFIIFQGYPTKQAAFLPGRLSPENQLLFQLLLDQEGYFAKTFEGKVFNFELIFLRIQFSLVATFFSSSFGYLFELIFAS